MTYHVTGVRFAVSSQPHKRQKRVPQPQAGIEPAIPIRIREVGIPPAPQAGRGRSWTVRSFSH
jgi:hypothetical protein